MAGYSRVTHPSATKTLYSLNSRKRDVSYWHAAFLPFSEQSVSVRLACVRRAASVRPEPGSNSWKFVSQHRSVKILKSQACSSLFLKKKIYLESHLHKTLRLQGSFVHFSMLFNFQGPIPRFSQVRFSLAHSRKSVNNFFSFLWLLLNSLGVSRRQLCYNIMTAQQCQHFFQINF